VSGRVYKTIYNKNEVNRAHLRFEFFVRHGKVSNYKFIIIIIIIITDRLLCLISTSNWFKIVSILSVITSKICTVDTMFVTAPYWCHVWLTLRP
jgi:hypothetical protein